MLNLRQIRPLDAAIAVAVVLVVILGGYLGYSVWAQNQQVKNSSPSSREIASLTAKLRANPNDFDSRMRLAQAYAIAGNDQAAIQQYQTLLKVNKNYVPALNGIGFEYLKQKRWKEGEPYFRKVIDLTEKEEIGTGTSPLETAYFYLGTALMEQRKYEDAAGYFKAAMRLRRDASDSAYALAVCYRELGIPQGYEENLLYTLQFDPMMPEANYDYGKLLLTKGDIASAAEHFRTSADAAPSIDLPRDELEKLGKAEDRLAAALASKTSNPVQALADARVAAALDPTSVTALVLVGELYESQNLLDKAAETYKKVLTLEPGNATATAGLKRVENGS